MEQAQKTSEVNTTSQQADKLKEAAEQIKADQKRREEEAVKEYQQFLVYLKEKYNVTIVISQPQVIIQSL